MGEQHVVLRHREIPELHRLDVYTRHGGYEQLRRAVTEMAPGEVIHLVKASGLRGRGGAGFPTGIKWSFVPREPQPKYVVVNNDESEPGAFKDREITLANPHQILEGAAIAAYAVGAEWVYIYCRGAFWKEMESLERAIEEASAAGYLGQNLFGSGFGLTVRVALGAGAYICGEETALLNSLSGRRGEPHKRPPFPAVEGLFGQPTVVNNTETLANVPQILARGAEWFRAIGTEKSAGTKVFSVSGHVERPGNYELPLGTPFGELLELAGGVWQGRQLKAMLPAGVSAPPLPAGVVPDLPLDWESVGKAGSDLGSASLIVMDETTDMVWVADRSTRFFEHESCGKCSPCREGTYWMKKVIERVRSGAAGRADLGLLADIVRQVEGKCLCPLGEFALAVPRATLALFPEEYERYVDGR